MGNQISRREFVEISAASIGAVTLACSGIAISDLYASDAPVAGQIPKRAIPRDGRILVAYATRCGSTTEVAEALGKDLQARGFKVDVLPVAKVTDLSPYQAVLLGSAVRMGNWLPEATGFVRQHQREMQNLPSAFFVVHIRNLGDDEKSREGRLSYLNEVHKVLRPDVEVFFAGKMDISKLTFGERMLCKVMGGKSQDRRDWPAIHAWGSNLFSSGVRS